MPVIQTLAGGLLAAGVAIFVNRQSHNFAREREEKAAAERLRNEKLAAEEKMQQERYFIATELIFMLEQFAEGCAQVANDHGEDNEAAQSERERTVDYPQINLSEVSGNWRVLSGLMMYRIRELPVLQNEAGRAISHASEHSWAPYHTGYFWERQYQYARLGMKAVILAMRLRKVAGLPETRLTDTEWSAIPVLWKVWRRERHRRTQEANINKQEHETVLP
ncbi:hypothetical protein [Pantoea septica]|uniref:hypothetical protein n=1 Tax=Pantoea septica TaxID=472695 RepID=UPI001FCC61BC|nr:hypothetical protein [Pantoea septica]